MFTPLQQKYQKQQKGRAFKKIINCSSLEGLKFGSFGLKSIDFGRITAKEIEAMYQAINKIIKKTGRVIIRIFAHTPITKKPIEVRMGKGKGNVDFWVSKVKAGTILCEVESNTPALALQSLKSAQMRLSIKTKIIKN
jgi:large subunit ribosomal protein L16